jgi:hypothetical protein
MKFENPDVDQLSEEWSESSENNAAADRLIQRVEDVPRIEDFSTKTIEWDVEGIIARGAFHAITGESGAGKSTFTAALGSAMSRGCPFMGFATARRPVLTLDAENPLVAVVERHCRLRIETGDHFRVWGQWTGEDPPSAGGAVVMEWVARCDPKPLVIIDSLIAFHPGAENDSSETRKYLAQYRRLTALGATVVLLHHSGKSDTARDYRGSSDIKASVDIAYKLSDLGDGSRLSLLELPAFKQRFSVTPRLVIRYEDGRFLTDEREAIKTVTEQLSDLLRQHPGVTVREFEKLAGDRKLGRDRARDFLENNNAVRAESGPKNRKSHYLRGVDD